MKYFRVPVVDGIPDLDFELGGTHIFYISNEETLYQVPDDTVVRESWEEVTQDEWNNAIAPALERVKEAKLVELEQTYQSSFTVFQSNALGELKTYPINEEAQKNLKDLQSRLIADPNLDEFPFLTLEDRILIDHTRIQFLQLLRDASTRMKEIHNQNRAYANSIDDATDIPTIKTMTFTFN